MIELFLLNRAVIYDSRTVSPAFVRTFTSNPRALKQGRYRIYRVLGSVKSHRSFGLAVVPVSLALHTIAELFSNRDHPCVGSICYLPSTSSLLN